MDRKLLFMLTCTTMTVALFHYMQYRQSQNTLSPDSFTPGQSIRIPSKEEILKPLEKNVTFLEKKVEIPESLTDIETDYYSITFSNYGATISSLDFKKRPGKNNIELKTIHPLESDHKEEAPFLLAFRDKTPYVYRVHDYSKTDTEHRIVYSTVFEGWRIYKTFVIPQKGYTINLECSFEPLEKNVHPLHPRLIVNGPYNAEIVGDNTEGFVFNSTKKTLEKYADSSDKEKAWVLPSLAGIEDRYFVHALIKDYDNFIKRVYFSNNGHHRLLAIMEGESITNKHSLSLQFYCGPKDIHDLIAVDERLEGLLNFGWFSGLCKLLIMLLEWLYIYFGNFGIAIIVLTILIKIPLTPLSMRGAEILEKAQRYQPQLKKLQERYKHDVQLLHQETMKFYRDHGMSSLGPIMGCLPQLLDIPIVMALYRVLGNYIDLYKAPFIGWIQDLSVADPYYILPLVMGAVTLWQQWLTPSVDEKQRIMGFFMAIMLTGLFANFSAGLVLYWTTKSVLMLGESYLRKGLARSR